jgi:hypothetical protein
MDEFIERCEIFHFVNPFRCLFLLPPDESVFIAYISYCSVLNDNDDGLTPDEIKELIKLIDERAR